MMDVERCRERRLFCSVAVSDMRLVCWILDCLFATAVQSEG